MPQKNKKFWNFLRSGNTAELILYGEISESTWWGDEVTPQKFNEELQAIGEVDEITVRINSGGGDVFAAAAIYTRLKDHKAKIIVKIDGWAASAATTIAMAGDEIQIANNGIFMIHDPAFGLFGYYNAQDMEKMQEELEVIKKGIISAYQLKTGKTQEEISELMKETTWYTAQEAMDAGFVDSLMFEGTVDAVAKASGELCVNGVLFMEDYHKVPKRIMEQCKNQEVFPLNQVGEERNIEQKKKGERNVDIKNKEELREAYPELVAEIEKDAYLKERTRIREIENIAVPGSEKIIDSAKYETGEQAGQVALKILNEQKEAGKMFLKNREEDVHKSGMEKVESSAPEQSDEEDKECLNAVNKVFPKAK